MLHICAKPLDNEEEFQFSKKKKKIHTDLQAEQEHRAECWDGLQREDT